MAHPNRFVMQTGARAWQIYVFDRDHEFDADSAHYVNETSSIWFKTLEAAETAMEERNAE